MYTQSMLPPAIIDVRSSKSDSISNGDEIRRNSTMRHRMQHLDLNHLDEISGDSGSSKSSSAYYESSPKNGQAEDNL